MKTMKRSGVRARLSMAGIRRGITLAVLAAFALALSGIGEDADAARKKRKRRAGQTIEKVVKEPVAETEAKVDDLLSAAPGAKVLEAGKLKAVIRSLTEGRTVLAGGSAFAEVTLRKPKGSRIAGAELRITGEGGGLSVLGGKGIRTRRDGRTLVAEIDLRKSAEQSFLIELKDDRSAGSRDRGMTIVLASAADEPSAASAPLAVSFRMADCSLQFREALAGILADKSHLFADGLKRAGAADGRLPGNWVFNPKNAAASSKKKRKKGEESTSLPFGVATDEERKLMAAATVYVRGQGAVSELGRRGRYSWVSNKVMADIQSYLEQGSNPALCAGVDVMADYIIGNTPYLKEAIDTAGGTARRAEVAARRHVAKLQSMVSSSIRTPAMDAGSGTFSLVGEANAATAATAPDTGGPEDLRPLVTEVAGRIFFSADAMDVAGAPDTLSALVRTAELLKSGAANGRTDELLAEARLALALIESTHYLAIGSGRYGLVGDAIYGSLEAIRDARDKTCNCTP